MTAFFAKRQLSVMLCSQSCLQQRLTAGRVWLFSYSSLAFVQIFKHRLWCIMLDDNTITLMKDTKRGRNKFKPKTNLHRYQRDGGWACRQILLLDAQISDDFTSTPNNSTLIKKDSTIPRIQFYSKIEVCNYCESSLEMRNYAIVKSNDATMRPRSVGRSHHSNGKLFTFRDFPWLVYTHLM